MKKNGGGGASWTPLTGASWTGIFFIKICWEKNSSIRGVK